MKIRKATIKDLEEIEKIYVRGCVDEVRMQNPKKSKKSILCLMKKNGEERLNSFRKELKNPKYCCLIAEINGEIVGFGQVRVEKITGKLKGFLDKIYLEKAFRGKDIGKSLGKKLIVWLRKKKAKTVECGIFIKNKPSIALCKSLGLNPVAVRAFKELK